MSYILNRTDGTILVELVDGILDTDTTDISLVGRNFTGYGEFINENFIKMLENFSNSTVPLAPLKGQLWYDTSINKLKIYNGEEFQPAAGSFVGIVEPQDPIAGDTWYNTSTNQLYLYDGEEFQLVGPQFTLQQGQSGVFVRTVQDTNLNFRTVLEVRIGETLQAVVSRIEIRPRNTTGNIIPELVTAENTDGTIFPGLNIVNSYDFQYRGTATRAQNLLSGTDPATEFSASQVLRNDENGILAGRFTIQGDVDTGALPELRLIDDRTRVVIEDGDLVIESARLGSDIRIKVAGAPDPVEAISIDSTNNYIGLFSPAPAYTLDVDGDTRITGNLIVEGTTMTIESTTISVGDKNLELGVTANPTNVTADGGGITLRGDTDKTFNWIDATDSWTLSENVDLAFGKEYRIDNTKVLDVSSLGIAITDAPGLVRVGNLDNVTSADIQVGVDEPSTINKINNPGLILDASFGGSTGDISVTNSKITDLVGPDIGSDAANKTYVDQEIDNSLIVFSFDITGWSPGVVSGNIILFLEQVFPTTVDNNGKQAKVITTKIDSVVIDGIDVFSNTAIDTAQVLVGPDPVTNVNQINRLEVVESITLPSNLSVPYTPPIVREVRSFEVVSGNWTATGVEPEDGNVQNI
jgi:hypothetical protein